MNHIIDLSFPREKDFATLNHGLCYLEHSKSESLSPELILSSPFLPLGLPSTQNCHIFSRSSWQKQQPGLSACIAALKEPPN